MRKMMTVVLAIMLTLALAAGASAATIEANGSAEVRVTPDSALLNMGVAEMGEDVKQAQTSVNERIEGVRQALYALNVAPSDIAVGSIYMYTNYDYSAGKETVVGYNVSHQLSITVRDLDSLGALIDAALDAGANQLNGVEFMLTDRTAAQAQALALAVESAQAHAETMAEAAGLTNLTLTGLVENGNYYSAPYMARAVAEDSASGGTSVDIGELSISAAVTATYEAEAE